MREVAEAVLAGTDEDLDTFTLVGQLDEVRAEVVRAHEKHGSESMVSSSSTLGKRLGIIGEEFGEVCRATTYDNGSVAGLREELVQLAAMAVSWVHVIDRERELSV